MMRRQRHSEYLHLRKVMGKETKSIERQEKFQKDMNMLWSVQEEDFLRTLICHLGTDWVAIAKDMKMRGHEMVCSSWFC